MSGIILGAGQALGGASVLLREAGTEHIKQGYVIECYFCFSEEMTLEQWPEKSEGVHRVLCVMCQGEGKASVKSWGGSLLAVFED